MTYLVLARKWRPRSFDTLVGQDHVVRALTHALDTQRLHHAWLFTGTRGVGKTTLSRILAKSLNCEQGITARPCGQCRACTEIDAGRYVDYVELDAASNRGVEEMTQLLEQAVYAPSSARFKVYMIDEVHMLSGHAFNAMLKTLEEPPPHVKFILATTDPQKIPVTVLSRCLQFNLKHMTVDAIVAYLQSVLNEEGLAFETPALRLLGQAASGSMRDALSLTDQAIAYSAGNLTLDAVQGMLGTIDQRYLVRLLQALAARQAGDVLAVADELAGRGLSYAGALADLAVLLSHIAIQQRVPGALPDGDPLATDVASLADLMHPDVVQLYYSIAVHSRNELSLAPDEYAGFVMACLRMLSLTPESSSPPDPSPSGGRGAASSSGGPQAAATQAPSPAGGPEATGAALARVAASASPVADSQPAAAEVVAQASPEAAEHTASADTGPDVPAWEALPDEPAASMRAASVTVDPVETTDPLTPPTTDPLTPPQGAQEASFAREGDVVPGVESDDFNSSPSATVEEPDAQQGGDEADAEVSGLQAAWPDEMPIGVPDDLPVDADFDLIPADDMGELDWENIVGDGGFDTSGVAPLPRKEENAAPRAPRLGRMSAQDWPALAASLPLTGLAAELARQSEWVGVKDDCITLRVAIHSLAARQGQARLRTVLTEHFGKVVQLAVEFGATGSETAHAVEQVRLAERQKEAEAAVAGDPFVKSLVEEFGARVIPGSIAALEQQRVA